MTYDDVPKGIMRRIAKQLEALRDQEDAEVKELLEKRDTYGPRAVMRLIRGGRYEE